MRNNTKGALVRNYDVTSAGVSAEQDRQHRMKVYFIMMAIRMVCVLSLIWVRGWWIAIPVLGAVLLPQIAVLIANVPANAAKSSPEQPQPQQLTSPEPTTQSGQPIIVVDEPADRRAAKGTTQPAADAEAITPEPLNHGESVS